MITPSFNLTATERVLPRMALDFTTGVLDSRVAITRAANTATRINSSGVIEIVNANLPRFDYDPSTLAARGLLIEETRSNVLLNSLINGTNLSTQSVTLSATAYTLSFYGTGSITISGGHVAVVSGTGAYPTRKTYTFTPLAGSSIFTVVGTVQYAQLEAGSFPSSFIPTAGAATSRNTDVALMTGTNFSDWYNQPEGTFYTEFLIPSGVPATGMVMQAGINSDTADRIRLNGATYNLGIANASSVLQVILGTTTYVGSITKFTAGYKLNNFGLSANGGAALTSASGTVPFPNSLNIGSRNSATPAFFLNGYVRKIMYWPQRLTNVELQAFSK
jgi:hypothetical protein